MRKVRLRLRHWVGYVALLGAGCRSGEAERSDPAPAPSHVEPAETRRDLWRPCRSNADCPADHACIFVDRQPEQALLLAVYLEPKACAWIAPPNLTLPDVQRLHLQQLLLFRKRRLTLGPPWCRERLIMTLDGAVVPCTSICQEQVALSGFTDVALVGRDGEPFECKPHSECERPSCPLEVGKDFEIAGVFQSVDEQLQFMLAKEPTAD